MAQGAPWDLELPFVTARGRRIWMRAVGEVEFENGRAVRLVGAFQDISDRRALQEQLAEREAFMRQITDAVPARIAYIDADLRFRFASRLMCDQLGLTRDRVIGRTRAEVAASGPRPDLSAREHAVLAGAEQRFEFDDVVHGERHRFECRFIPDRDPDGAVRGFFSIAVDITARSDGEQRLRALSTMLRTVAESIPAAVAVVGSDQRYRFVNSAFERWIGASREQIVGHTVREVIGRADQARSQPWIDRALAGETVQFERDYAAAGRPRHLAVSCTPLAAEDGRIDGFVAMLQDISEHRLENVRLLNLTQLDALTGLLNRSGLEQALAQRLHAGQGATLALLVIDLDRFKPVNDEHGHAIGDAVLLQVGQRLRRLVRPTDAVARLGGDEFVVLLTGVLASPHAHAVAVKVVEALQQPFDVGALRLSIGASVGVAFGLPSGGDGAALLARADAMLLRAKRGGRGCAVLESESGPALG